MFKKLLKKQFDVGLGGGSGGGGTVGAVDDRKISGVRCDHKGCGILFRTKRERLEHLFKDYHCEKCGFGTTTVPRSISVKMRFCRACQFERESITLVDSTQTDD